MCLPLSAGEDTFKLHSVQVELEAVEKKIRDLVERQAQLRERRAALETSRADAHKPGVSIQRAANSPITSTPCVSLHRPGAPRTQSSQMSFTPGCDLFEISTRNRFAPLHETERDAVIVGDSIVRPRVNDTKLRQTETLKKDFRSLIETMCSTSPATTIIVSEPLPTFQRGHKRFSRLFALNEWLLSWCKEQKMLFVNNWNLFWERPRLFCAEGLHPSRVGAELLSDNISRTLCSICLVSQISNNCHDDFCSTRLNDRSTCAVQSIKTVCSNSEVKILI
uniref:SGNH hydrolase-type esterase domain-containing protein n=1 Tax=Sinocyclocheilus rhinocerous TaxID=307959 RepID=A0A673N2B9_9TELE